jgi:hypothetical protein
MGELRPYQALPGELASPAPALTMELLGLAVFQEAGDPYQARLWVGHTDTKLSDHDRWLYTTFPNADGWLPCIRLESRCEESFYTYPQRSDAYESLLGLLRSLETVRSDLRNYFTQGQAHHSIAWLLAQKLALGFTDPYLIAKLPLGIDWALAHELMMHREAWFEANPEFREMPFELTMRMHGLASLWEPR